MLRHALPIALLLLSGDDEKGFKPLFNGKDFEGWKFYFEEKGADPAKTFSAKDGVVVCTGQPAGYMYTAGSYKEFTLRFDWQYARPADLKDDEQFAGNSGYLLFVSEQKVWPKSIEIQGMNRKVADVIPIGGAKAIAKTDAEARAKARKPVGEWNAMEITVKGGKITATLNGAVISTITDYDPKEGPIGFQSEGAEIHWRNIRIRTE